MVKQMWLRAFGGTSRRAARNRRLRKLEVLEERRVLAAVSGHVIEDLNANGMIDPDEPGQAGVEVYIDANENGALDRFGAVLEPDHFDELEPIVLDGVTLSLAHEDNEIAPGQTIVARERVFASTGQHVFGTTELTAFNHFQRLRMDFDEPVDSVSIDFIGDRQFSGEIGVLEIYDGSGALLAEDRSEERLEFEYETLRLERAEGDIAFAVAYTQLIGLTGRFDALRINDAGSETWTITGAEGQYGIQNLDAGQYSLRQVVPESHEQTLPVDGGGNNVVVTTDDVEGVNFANALADAGSPWQNPLNPYDVNADGTVAPLDVLLIINEMNEPRYSEPGSGLLQPPPDPIPAYFDVDGDGYVVPKDAIEVINFINSPQSPVVESVEHQIGAALDHDSEDDSHSSAKKATSQDTQDPHTTEVELLHAAAVDRLFD